MVRAVGENFNQYCRSAGHTPLVQQLAKRYTAELGRPVSAESEVTVGVGASECLFAVMQSFVNPGDEVVLISPAFDIYIAQVQMAGGVCKYVPLRLAADPADPAKQGACDSSRRRRRRRRRGARACAPSTSADRRATAAA